VVDPHKSAILHKTFCPVSHLLCEGANKRREHPLEIFTKKGKDMNNPPSPFGRQLLLTILTGFVFLILAQPAFGQTTKVTVRVTDPGGKAIRGATVEAINKVTKNKVTGTTAADGTVVLDLLAGKYDITIQSVGFAQSIRKDVEVEVAEFKIQTIDLEFTMRPEELRNPIRRHQRFRTKTTI
jgi:hypothetical protein